MATVTTFSTSQSTPSVLSGIATVDAGETTTLSIPIHGRAVVRIGIPSAFTSTAISFLVQTAPGRAFRAMVDGAGSAVSKTVAAGQNVLVPELSGAYAFEIVCGSVEGSARLIEVACTGIDPVAPGVGAAGGAGGGDATAALQTVGNNSLSSIDGKTPVLGQALAAASVPIVLTAAQLTTLTPPAGGSATAANQVTGNTSLASIDTKFPAQGQALAAASVPVVLTASQLNTLTPTAGLATSANQTTGLSNQTTGNTSLASLDTKLPPQGQAVAGSSMPVVLPAAQITTLTPPTSVGLTSASYVSVVSATRAANTTAYTANDVIGAANSGGTAAFTLASIGPSAGSVIITSVEWRYDTTSATNQGNIRLYFYNVTPPSAYADNVPWQILSGDRASYLDYIDIGTPALPSTGSTSLIVSANKLNMHIKLAAASTSLFVYAVTGGTFTPGNADTMQLTVHALAL